MASGLGVWLLVFSWSRAGGLHLGFWNDEVYTVLNYVDPGPAAIFGERYLPNNHVLFSWLAWRTTQHLGKSEAIYRLWSVVPAVLAVVVAVGFAYRRVGAAVALVFAFLATTSSVHLELAPQARGYGLAFLASVTMLVGAVRVSDAAHRYGSWILLAAGGWVGIATLPVFVLPFFAQLTAVALHPGRRRLSVVVGIGVAAAAYLFYGDLVRHIWLARTQQFGTPIGLATILTGPASHVVLPPHHTNGSTLDVVAVALTTVSLVAGAVQLGWRRDWGMLANLVMPIVLTYGGLFVMGVSIVPRFVSYLLVQILLLLACGVVALFAPLTRGRGRALAWTAAAALAVAITGDFIRRTGEAHSLPLEGYKDAAAIVRAVGAKRAVTNSLYSAGFDYYLPATLEYPPPDQLSKALCDREGTLVFVEYPMYPNGGDTSCARSGRVARYDVPQRVGGPAGWIRVWVVEPATPATRPPPSSTSGLSAERRP